MKNKHITLNKNETLINILISNIFVIINYNRISIRNP